MYNTVSPSRPSRKPMRKRARVHEPSPGNFKIFDLARIQETIEPTNKPTSQPVVNPPAVVGTGPRNSITAKLLDWRRVSSIHTTVSTLFRRSNREETSLCVLYICDPSPSFIGKWETNSSVSVTRITEI